MRRNLRKLFFAGAIVGLLAAATLSTALAAKGVITDVNPSGIVSIKIHIDPSLGGRNVAQVTTPGLPSFDDDVSASSGQ